METKLKRLITKINITSLHIENYLATAYNLKKNYIIKTINKDTLLKIMPSNYQEIDYTRLEKMPAYEEVKNFINFVSKHFKEEDLLLFYKNINNVTIMKLTSSKDNPLAGTYHILKNQISTTHKSHIYHELFHMTSCQYGNVGFHNNYLNSGIGINEGFTELLTRKYFGCSENDCSYLVETSVASVLSSIIGEEKMTKLYMEGNYFGLLIALDTYLDPVNLSDFFHKLDRFTFLTSKSSVIFINFRFITKSRKNISFRKILCIKIKLFNIP